MTCNSCGFEERCPPYDRCDEMERQRMDAMTADAELNAMMAELSESGGWSLPPGKNDIEYWL